MLSICGVDCCVKCSQAKKCGGCQVTNGHPFGGNCIAAECIARGGTEEFLECKSRLITEINALGIKGLEVHDLNLLNGFFVNMEYTLPNGERIKLLKDQDVYLGNQIERADSERCYGVAADDKYLLVCEYGCNGENPEIILYKKR